MIPFDSLGGPPPTDGRDCFLPGVGDVEDVSFSQDGTSMAWEDNRGVVVAGTPVWFPSAAVSTCNLSRPPVVISATGADAVDRRLDRRHDSPGPTHRAAGGTGAVPAGRHARPRRRNDRPRTAGQPRQDMRARALRSGIPLTVAVRRAGRSR